MNVLLLVHGLPVGGTETMVCCLARRLRNEGLGVAIGCLDLAGELGEEMAAEGFPVDLFSRKPGLDIALPARIARTVRARRCDVVHAHQYTCFFYGVLAKLLTGTPLVFTEHGRFHPDLPSLKRRLFNRVFAGRADRVTAVSRRVRESLARVEGFDPERIEVVYNGIDVERLAAERGARERAREVLGLPLDARVVGTVGRLDAIKNHRLLLGAFKLVSERVPGALLVLIGDGPERDRLRSLAGELGIGGSARFAGQRRDAGRLLAAFDAFALSSFSEGTPMTLIEAMAASVPIVATTVGGVPEILRDGEEALLVGGTPPAFPDAASLLASEHTRRFAETLGRVLTDTPLAAALAGGALERARRELSLDAICEKYVSLYREVAPMACERQAREARRA
ncbi:MAG: glycosyltransferase [Planctomycetes bacterium]|nr:glycosyltransferase [Planctomycetota bacterium]